MWDYSGITVELQENYSRITGELQWAKITILMANSRFLYKQNTFKNDCVIISQVHTCSCFVGWGTRGRTIPGRLHHGRGLLGLHSAVGYIVGHIFQTQVNKISRFQCVFEPHNTTEVTRLWRPLDNWAVEPLAEQSNPWSDKLLTGQPKSFKIGLFMRLQCPAKRPTWRFAQVLCYPVSE